MSQLFIGFAPVYLLLNLQIRASNKRLAMVSFMPNITYVILRVPPGRALTQRRTLPLIVLRLVYLFKASHSSDRTMGSFDTALITVIHANYSIIASCLPFLKPLADSFAVGLTTNNIGVPIRLEDSTKKKDKINPFAILGRKGFSTRNFYGWTRSQSSAYTATVTAGTANNMELQDLERYGPRDRMVINQTKTTVVASDSRNGQP